MPMPSDDEAQRTGKILRSTISRFKPGRMSCGSRVPWAKNFSMRSSSPSATALDERLVLGLRPLGELRRDRAVDALAALVDVRLHAHEVDRAVERLLLADRDLERHDAAAELLVQRLDRAVEGGALAVHPVDDEEHGAPELQGELPGALGLDLDARDRVEDDERGSRRRRPRPRASGAKIP